MQVIDFATIATAAVALGTSFLCSKKDIVGASTVDGTGAHQKIPNGITNNSLGLAFNCGSIGGYDKKIKNIKENGENIKINKKQVGGPLGFKGFTVCISSLLYLYSLVSLLWDVGCLYAVKFPFGGSSDCTFYSWFESVLYCTIGLGRELWYEEFVGELFM